jgi:hypothetical protein
MECGGTASLRFRHTHVDFGKHGDAASDIAPAAAVERNACE